MIITFLLVVSIYAFSALSKRKRIDLDRFYTLVEDPKTEVNWSLARNRLKLLGDKFGRAGFYSVKSRNQFYILTFFILIFSFVILTKLPMKPLIAAFVSVYLTTLLALMYLKHKSNDIEREILFRLPLFLESVILLVESGLGVLPAVQSVILSSRKKNEPVSHIMQAVYELSSSGLPFSNAIELVAKTIDNKPLKHVLLHLDLSSSEGGALVPSLRSLAEYAHCEWKLGVESRVKRLENTVVFPVFAAVIGLMLLVISVPIVPVVDFFSNLNKQNSSELINSRSWVPK